MPPGRSPVFAALSPESSLPSGVSLCLVWDADRVEPEVWRVQKQQQLGSSVLTWLPGNRVDGLTAREKVERAAIKALATIS